jgi:hypothetical protein
MHNRDSRCGEVAEPGLRRTPGTRVDSKGSRGFESPPLRQSVRDFRALRRKPENSAHVRAFSSTWGHRRGSDSPVSSRLMFDSLRREASRCPSANFLSYQASLLCGDFFRAHRLPIASSHLLPFPSRLPGETTIPAAIAGSRSTLRGVTRNLDVHLRLRRVIAQDLQRLLRHAASLRR